MKLFIFILYYIIISCISSSWSAVRIWTSSSVCTFGKYTELIVEGARNLVVPYETFIIPAWTIEEKRFLRTSAGSFNRTDHSKWP
jgi:regulator of protease activity HflC (stomatin/prohibitin superfamily)